MSKIPKSAQECQSLAWVLPFIGSDLFILTSTVMPSIIMEVIHMYVSIVIKLSKYLTGLLCIVYQQLIKVNVNSFICDALFTQVNKVHDKFTPSALRLNEWSLHPDRYAVHPDGYSCTQTGTVHAQMDKISITSPSLIKMLKAFQMVITLIYIYLSLQ